MSVSEMQLLVKQHQINRLPHAASNNHKFVLYSVIQILALKTSKMNK